MSNGDGVSGVSRHGVNPGWDACAALVSGG